MVSCFKAVIAGVCLALSHGALAQSEVILKIVKPAVKLLGAEHRCVFDKGTCTVPVPIDALVVDGVTYCLVKLPSKIILPGTGSIVPGTGSAQKKLVWELAPHASLKEFSFEFQEKNGIIILKDYGKDQISDGKRESELKWSVKSAHDKAKSVATYLPVVMQIDAQQNQNVCAATDPTIVNE